MMHALDPETKRTLVPNLPPLTNEEATILQSNEEFFRRAAIHSLAEGLKKMAEVSEESKKHIHWKFHWFQKMMTSYVKPPAGPDGKVQDPVDEYGWKREVNGPEISKLQKQYLDVTMRCYELGYKIRCPMWMKFLKHPVYWFKLYASWLTRGNVDNWTITLPGRNNDLNAMPAQAEVLQWGNKLSLLRHAAPAEAQAELDVDKVTTELNSTAQLSLVYSGLVNEDSARRTEEVSPWTAYKTRTMWLLTPLLDSEVNGTGC